MGRILYDHKYTNQAPLIVLEGADGVGKTTLADEIVTILEFVDIDAISTREPGSPTSTACCLIRTVLAQTDLTPDEEKLLFCADRLIHHRTVISPALKEGFAVVSDRGPLSTFVYQTLNREGSVVRCEGDVLRKLNDNTFFDVTVVLKREDSSEDIVLLTRDEDSDHMATRAAKQKEAVREAYNYVADACMSTYANNEYVLGSEVSQAGTTMTTAITIKEEDTEFATALRIIDRVVALCERNNACVEFVSKWPGLK